MTEQLVLFETAKLAKEKGFDEPCNDCYNSFGNLLSNGWCEYIDDNEVTYPFGVKSLKEGDILRPTQSLLQKWLRETYNIEAYVVPTYYFKEKEYQGYYGKIDDIQPLTGDLGGYIRLDTNEKSLELGLQEALKLI